MSTTPATATATPIRVKNATAPPAVEPLDTSKPPLEAALDRLTTTRQRDVAAAFSIYRAHADALSRDIRLDVAQTEALSLALETLGFKPADLRADVLALRQHRETLATLAKLQQQQVAEESRALAMKEEEERITLRLRDIAAYRLQLQAMFSGITGNMQIVNELVAAHPRVLGELAPAIEKIINPPGPRTMRVIRAGDDAPLPTAVAVPDLQAGG